VPYRIQEGQTARKVSDYKPQLLCFSRGGIAIVWLGLNESQEYVAMKQFPKQGNKVDSTASVELGIHQLIKEKGEPRGK